MGAQHEILNHEGLVAFEARAGRDGPGLDDALLMNGQIGALGALAPAFARRTLLGQGLAGLLHAARLDLGPAFEPLETGDLVPLGRDGALQRGDLDHERNHQRPEIRKRPRVQISGQSHARNQSEITPAGNPIRPDFRPSYRKSISIRTIGIERDPPLTGTLASVKRATREDSKNPLMAALLQWPRGSRSANRTRSSTQWR